MAKMYTLEMAVKIGEAVQIHGGYGFTMGPRGKILSLMLNYVHIERELLKFKSSNFQEICSGSEKKSGNRFKVNKHVA